MATSSSPFLGRATELTYPYIMVRRHGNSFSNHPIWFIKKAEKELMDPEDKRLVIAVPDTADAAGGFDVSRQLIIDSVKMHLIGQRHAMCVVFDEDDCVYVGHDGSTLQSNELPSREIKYQF